MQRELLEKINNISELYSEVDEEENSGSEDSIYDPLDSDSEVFDTDNEEENVVNTRRGRKRMRLFSSSEDECEENDQNIETSVDGTVWQKIHQGSGPGRSPLHTIFREISGPTGYAKRNIMKGKVRSAFSLILDQGIMNHIKMCTESEARRVLGSEWSITLEELDAFIAILYARGAYETRNLNVSYLWNKKWGPAFFSRTMNRNRFTEIMRFIRFDRKSERSQRLQTDKFALISKVWNAFIENSQNCYKPGANITVDEQLFATKSRCRFTQYMPNKPDKFGIKFWLASDVESKYIVNGFPYLGKDETRPSAIPLSEFVVLKLTEPFIGCGRNITTDNFFTSTSLATKLLSKRTTLVGTIRANKRELPKPAKEKKDKMARFSTQLYKSNNCTLTIYKSKPNKKVLLLSSKHKYVKIEETGKFIPETIAFYNHTKFGVDMTDQMARKYSTKSKSNRWPVQVFFNILDLAAINAWVLYKQTTGEKISRQEFLFQLAEELATEYRYIHEQGKMESMAKTSADSTTISERRKTCQIGYCKKNKTINICSTCKKYVCGKCVRERPVICKKCDNE